MATAASYEQALNGSPNYGTDAGAYGQRVGAAAIRDASQTIFSDSIMAPILREDPRYYVMGKSPKCSYPRRIRSFQDLRNPLG